MPYTKTTWTNESPASSPVKYKIVDDAVGDVAGSATIEPVTEITPGTPLNSTNLNKIEQGIADATAAAEAQVTTAKLLDGILSADAAGRAKMADGFVTLAKLSADLRFQKLAEFAGNGTALPDWTSLPQTFSHLLLIYNGLSSRETAGYDAFNLRVNGDAGSSYYATSVEWESQQFNYNWGITNPNADGLVAGILPSQNAGFLQPGSGIALLPHYSGSGLYKSCLMLAGFFGNYVVGFQLAYSYRLSADPITRLTGNLGGPAPRTGSLFSLYGFN